MPELIAKSPLAGRAPRSLGGTTLAEAPIARMTSVAPLKGQDRALNLALKALGLAFPAPNRFAGTGGARLVWTGRDQAFLIGPEAASLAPHAALSDQSDGWAALRLEGPEAEAVLARLYPLDLRSAAFPPGHAARAPLNHMPSVLMRLAPAAFELLVFRSMASTAWHEIEAAMQAVAARAARG